MVLEMANSIRINCFSQQLKVSAILNNHTRSCEMVTNKITFIREFLTGVHKFSKNLDATSKFYEPEG